MKEVDIEGVKIQFKNMTMLTWSTIVKVKNSNLFDIKIITNSSTVSNTHFQDRKVNIEGLLLVAQNMTRLTMRRTDKNDSPTILLEKNENSSVK